MMTEKPAGILALTRTITATLATAARATDNSKRKLASMKVVTFITLLAALLTIWQVLRGQAEAEQEKEYAANTFKTAEQKTQDLHNKISQYADDHDAWNAHFMQGFTFREAIDVLEKSEREIFTKENLETLKNSAQSGRQFEFLVERLEKHQLFLTQSETFFERNFDSG